MSRLQALSDYLSGLGRVLLGYSGGVDSSLLAVVGARSLGPRRFLAVLGLSPSLATDQRVVAESIARDFGVPLRALATDELSDPQYVANPENRCYFCKSELWRRLTEYAAAHGFDAVIDGTHAEDLGEHRPGMRAGRERAVRSPLADLGWRKEEVREAARSLGIPIWSAPASPCLASRIRYGLPVTVERLRQVERGEGFLRGLGLTGDLRVRHLGHVARVEVHPAELARVRDRWPEVVEHMRDLGFDTVHLAPEGYRRGALLTLLEPV